jgi:hypothetical protein
MWLWPRVEIFLPFVFWKLRRILYFVQDRVEMYLRGQEMVAEDKTERLKKDLQSFAALSSDCGSEAVQF